MQISGKNSVFLNPNTIVTLFDQRSLVDWEASFSRCDIHTDLQTDIATYRWNRPRGGFIENDFRSSELKAITYLEALCASLVKLIQSNNYHVQSLKLFLLSQTDWAECKNSVTRNSFREILSNQGDRRQNIKLLLCKVSVIIVEQKAGDDKLC